MGWVIKVENLKAEINREGANAEPLPDNLWNLPKIRETYLCDP